MNNKISLLGITIFSLLFFKPIAQANPDLNRSKKQLSIGLDRQSIISQDKDYQRLENKLKEYQFKIKYEIPPNKLKYGKRALGAMQPSSKTIWINPIVFDLGNAKHVLVHESVHAAQTCKGNGQASPLELEIKPDRIAFPYFMRYKDTLLREIEAEAYTIQTQPDSLQLAIDLLNKHCRKASNSLLEN